MQLFFILSKQTNYSFKNLRDLEQYKIADGLKLFIFVFTKSKGMNPRKVLFLTLFIFISLTTFSQKNEIIIVEGEAHQWFPEHKSELQVKKEAENKAIINALEKAFGVMVIEGNTMYVQDIQSGKKSETNTVFNSIANTCVKGELVEVLDKSFEEVYGTVYIGEKEEKVKEIKCTVKIRARELEDNPVNFEMYPLNCLDIHCKTNTFKADIDDFYIYFRSPVSGYIAIFLDDGKQAQQLLPYQSMRQKFEQGVPISANNEYFLFSNKNNYFGSNADEYIFKAEQLMEQERLFFIFSKKPIVQPYLKQGYSSEKLSEAEKESGWKIPDALPSEDFQRWLIKSRMNNRGIVVQVEDITIKK
jgi:ribosomal protein L23